MALDAAMRLPAKNFVRNGQNGTGVSSTTRTSWYEPGRAGASWNASSSRGSPSCLEKNLMKVGFIGLGNIGKPMAEQLVPPPFELTVYDAVPAAMAPFAGKARLASLPSDLARTATLIGICVRHD